VISVALVSILSMLRVAISYTNKTRQETIAINLARESMEAVYNRRNTNRLKWSGEKDKYWLVASE
jgi:Tfp pilus assembly protein PilV